MKSIIEPPRKTKIGQRKQGYNYSVQFSEVNRRKTSFDLSSRNDLRNHKTIRIPQGSHSLEKSLNFRRSP